MLEFFSFLALLAVAYLVWRVTDQLPDLIFRMSEIQRDVAELRRRMTDESEPQPSISSTATTAATATATDTVASTTSGDGDD